MVRQGETMHACERPSIAIISNSHTPYRLHLHRRIAREIPEVRLRSIYTHEISNAPWRFDEHAGQEIGAMFFGKGESSATQAYLRHSFREWRRAGRIIEWMVWNNVRFVLMMGYNDIGRVRIIRWCRRMKVPCWLFGDSNIRGDRGHPIKRAVKRALIRPLVRSCDGIFCCGCLGRQYFLRYGADPNRCVYFPYEPDYEAITSIADQAVAQARERFSLSATRRRIVFSGRLTAIKRPDLAIAAFVAIAAVRPDWDLLMIGDGPLSGELKLSVPPALRGRVLWTGFLDDQAAINALYRASEVLVLPSDVEPWGLVINEGVAAGLAIVSSDIVGASAELVRDGFNGRLFPPGDLAALTACLLDVTDPDRLQAMGQRCEQMLANWRRRGDPVTGLRNTLVAASIIEGTRAAPPDSSTWVPLERANGD